MSKNYDFNKVRAIIAEKLSKGIENAELGMQEDWGWTAESVFSNGQCTLPDTDTGPIAGIGGSAWATPGLKIDYIDGSEEVFDCYQDAKSTASPEEIAAMMQFVKLTGGMDNVK